MLYLLSLPVHAASKKAAGPPAPGSKAALTLALTAAQKVYLRYAADESTAARYIADYTAFYQDMQAWGRYHLLSSTEGADLVILYTDFCRDECSIDIYDGRTLAWVGSINQYLGGSTLHVSNEARTKGAAKLIKTLKSYAGASHFANAATQQAIAAPILPLPAWASSLGVDSAPHVVEEHISQGVLHSGTAAFQNTFLDWAKTVHNILIVDERLSMSTNTPFGRKDALNLFENDITEGRLKLVSALSDADIVLDLSATAYCDEDSCTDSLDMSIKDPTTLRVLTTGSIVPNLTFKKNHPDPFPGSVQDLVNQLRAIVEDTMP
jgi:hypothetical protein